MTTSTATDRATVTVDLIPPAPGMRPLADLLRHGLRAQGLEVLDDRHPAGNGTTPGHRVRAAVIAAGGTDPRWPTPGPRSRTTQTVVVSPARDRRLVTADGAVFVSLQVVDGLAGLARLLADVARAPGGRHADVEQRLPLTDSQVAVARLVAAGHGNRRIAAVRHTSESAVRNMVSRILDRLDIPSADGENARVRLARAIAEAETCGLMTGALPAPGWG